MNSPRRTSLLPCIIRFNERNGVEKHLGPLWPRTLEGLNNSRCALDLAPLPRGVGLVIIARLNRLGTGRFINTARLVNITANPGIQLCSGTRRSSGKHDPVATYDADHNFDATDRAGLSVRHELTLRSHKNSSFSREIRPFGVSPSPKTWIRKTSSSMRSVDFTETKLHFWH